MTNQSDIYQAKSQFLGSLPDKVFLKEMYIKLCNFFRIGINEGLDEEFSFNINQFCSKYNFPILKTYNGIQFLDNQGVISMSQGFSEKISMQFLLESKEVIRYICLNPKDENVILAVLRNYPGIYEAQTQISIPLIARKSGEEIANVSSVLLKMKEKEVIDYKTKNNDVSIIFNEIRDDDRTINKVAKFLEKQNEVKKANFQSVLDYVLEKNHCKSREILTYFGEKDSSDCGICSYCITKINKNDDLEIVSNKILKLLKMQPMSSREIERLTKNKTANVVLALQDLSEKKRIKILTNNTYQIK